MLAPPCCRLLLPPVLLPPVLLSPPTVPRPRPARPLQCKDVLPLDEMPDGSKPPQRWGHYQHWWQTIMTKAAPELRGLGWRNLKCASAVAGCWGSSGGGGRRPRRRERAGGGGSISSTGGSKRGALVQRRCRSAATVPNNGVLACRRQLLLPVRVHAHSPAPCPR